MGINTRDKSMSLVKTVAATDDEILESSALENGEKWRIKKMYGSGCGCNNTKCEIRFGTTETYEQLFVTHGDMTVLEEKIITGDDSKKVKLLLVNDLGTSETMQVGMEAYKIT